MEKINRITTIVGIIFHSWCIRITPFKAGSWFGLYLIFIQGAPRWLPPRCRRALGLVHVSGHHWANLGNTRLGFHFSNARRQAEANLSSNMLNHIIPLLVAEFILYFQMRLGKDKFFFNRSHLLNDLRSKTSHHVAFCVAIGLSHVVETLTWSGKQSLEEMAAGKFEKWNYCSIVCFE